MAMPIVKQSPSSCSLPGRNHKGCAILAALALSFACFGASKAAAQEAQPAQETHQAEQQPKAPIEVRKPSPVELENWRLTILKTSRPASDKCYSAKYPDTVWTEVPCSTPPHKAYPPRGRTRALQVGNGLDFSAIPASGAIQETEGSFDTSSNITSECAVACTISTTGITCPASPSCTGSTNTDSYSLQLNTAPFYGTSACSTSPNGTTAPNGCSGFEQFVYESGGTGFIQYWLEQWGPPAGSSGYRDCPAPHGTSCAPGGSVETSGWCEYPLYGQTYCVVNAVRGTSPITEPISNIADFHVTAYTAGTAGMTTDSLAVSVTGGTASTAPGNNYFPDLGTKWTEAEFNVFGDGGGDQAVFNDNSSLTVRTGELSGTTLGPTCDETSFTGESNNFTLNNVAPMAMAGSMPALVFTEVNPAPAGSLASCADATSVGDTHLTTFDGLYYDFQAFGDFVLVQNGSDFEVQTRQVPGPPGYPNTAVNKAVAMQMGKSRVALYIEPTLLTIDGNSTALADGKTINLPTGVQIARTGDTYSVSDDNGNHVTVVLDPQWINVTVGLGISPAHQARGLLGNPSGNAHELVTASGAVLKEPVLFTDLYHTYADSWRVQEKDSLFTDPVTAQAGAPATLFDASNIDPQLAGPALAACKAAGITNQALLDACTLDSVVLNDKIAIKVFVHAIEPIHPIKPVLHLMPLAQ
ncbi:MAG: VWD domain-containing protein [Terracidiphilus sp.]